MLARERTAPGEVGQAGSLRGGWLPPLSGANARGTRWVGPIANRPQLAKLPHNSAPSLAYTYARSQAALLMNCVGVHFCVAHPLPAGGAEVAEEGTALALLAFGQRKIEFGLRCLKVPNGLFGTVD